MMTKLVDNHHYEKNITLASGWVLAEHLARVLPAKIVQHKLIGSFKDGHRYFSKREVLSVIEQHLNENDGDNCF